MVMGNVISVCHQFFQIAPPTVSVWFPQTWHTWSMCHYGKNV